MRATRGRKGMMKICAWATEFRIRLYGEHVSFPNAQRTRWAHMLNNELCSFSMTELHKIADEYAAEHGLAEGRGLPADEMLLGRVREYIRAIKRKNPSRYNRVLSSPGYIKKGAGVQTIKNAIEEHQAAAELLAKKEKKAKEAKAKKAAARRAAKKAVASE